MKLYFANHDFRQLSVSGADKILVSYWYHQDNLSSTIQRHYGSEEVKIFADSGAFSAGEKDTTIEVKEYADWLLEHKDKFEVYANLDIIGDQIKTRENQDFLESAGLAPIPVFHIGSGFKELRELVDKYDYIAIGGMVPYMKKAKTIAKVLSKIFDIAKDVRLHGFGCTNTDVLFSFPWYSVDSSTWMVGAKYGEIPIFDERVGRVKRIKIGDWKSWRKVKPFVDDIGYDWRELASRSNYTLDTNLKVSRKTFSMVEKYLTDKWGK